MKIQYGLLLVLFLVGNQIKAQIKVNGLFDIPFGTTKSEVKQIVEIKGFLKDTLLSPEPDHLFYIIKTEEGYLARVTFNFKEYLLSSVGVEYEVSNKTLAFFCIKQRLLKTYGIPNIQNEENQCMWGTNFGHSSFGILSLQDKEELILISMFTIKKGYSGIEEK